MVNETEELITSRIKNAVIMIRILNKKNDNMVSGEHLLEVLSLLLI